MIVVKGFRELDRQLASLGDEVGRQILFDGVREGADVIRDEARIRAPRRLGILARNIQTRMRRRKKGAVEALIGTTAKAWYARLVEFGTAPHEIKVKAKQALASAKGVIYGRKVFHPGTAPRPFLRPAIETKQAQATETMGRVIWWGIQLHTKRQH